VETDKRLILRICAGENMFFFLRTLSQMRKFQWQHHNIIIYRYCVCLLRIPVPLRIWREPDNPSQMTFFHDDVVLH
jgi:hypothetical protein